MFHKAKRRQAEFTFLALAILSRAKRSEHCICSDLVAGKSGGSGREDGYSAKAQ